MWTKQRITDDLFDLGITAGDTLLVHASMRAVGPVEGGADTVIETLLDLVGPDGTLMAPFFNPANRLRADSDPVNFAGPEEPFREDTADVSTVGILAQRLGSRTGARRGAHPSLSFAAVGHNAAFLTENAPFHYPFGTNGPLARLHQLNGRILLLGVGHTVNSSIHLAEVWADAPYARRKCAVRTGEETWVEMEGSPECSAGFARIEPILRQARIVKSGYVGNASSQVMRAQFVVSMAMEMLRGRPDCLLCENPACEHCALARKMTRPQDAPGTIER
jgi:aminoglycoside 3-N-acetyltransferase